MFDSLPECVRGPFVIDELAALDPQHLSAAARVDALVAWERHIAWAQAQQLRLLAVMAESGTGPRAELDRQWVREDVACALRLSAGTAADRLELAVELTNRLPDTLALLERGETTVHHARHLAESVCALDAASATVVESQVLAGAAHQNLAAFKRSVRRAVLAADPRGAEQRHDAARADRRVALTPTTDGMAELWALLPAEGAASLMAAVQSLADGAEPGDPRTADQRRADALVELGCCALSGQSRAGSDLPRQHGMRPAVQVTVALSTLLGLDDQPGELDGYGPLPAGLVRRISHDPTGTWRRLVTDDRGRLVDRGRTTYRPPRDLTEHVIAQDRTCRFPGCHRAARRCDLDHVVDWSHGGSTDRCNLQCLCPRHHAAKHDAEWRAVTRDDGDTDWVSPTGHRYRSPAATYPVDGTIGPPDTPPWDTPPWDTPPRDSGPADSGPAIDGSTNADPSDTDPSDTELPPF